MENEIAEVNEIVDEVTDKKTFNIFDAINNRSYPHTTVNVFIDEELAFRASELEGQIEELQPSAVTVKEDGEKLAKLEKELAGIIKKIEEAKYVFHVYGISEGEREKLLDIATEKFPIEFDETRNNYTGEVSRIERESVERDRFFTGLLWKAQIRKIEAPDGSVQESLSDRDVDALRTQLPIASIAEINRGVDKVRAATAVFMSKVNQDFLAKR